MDCHRQGAGQDGISRSLRLRDPTSHTLLLFHLAREIQESRLRALSACPLPIPTTPPRRPNRRCIRKIRQTLLRPVRRYLLSQIFSTRFYRWGILRNLFPSPSVHVLSRIDPHKERTDRWPRIQRRCAGEYRELWEWGKAAKEG